MSPDNRVTERTFAIFLLGALLLLPPLLLVFNTPTRTLGVPALYLYVFFVWAVLIALATATARRLASDVPPPGQDEGSKTGAAPPAKEWVRDA